MKTISLLALAALVGVGFAAQPAAAQKLPRGPVCIAAPCGPNGSPGEPFIPERPCVFALGDLPTLTRNDIAAIVSSAQVIVEPICDTGSLVDQDLHLMIEHGNVKGLAGWIDRNAAIRGKLSLYGYQAIDVVAIDPADDGTARVFVHHRRG